MAERKSLEIEALMLAKNKCIGEVRVEHVLELRRLMEAGLVRNVKTEWSAYYVLTGAGRARLEALDG